jgi:1-acyl-sn-glycerol-3-phosphate acyltransferase
MSQYDDLNTFKEPSAAEMALFHLMAEPWYWLYRPLFKGWDNIPKERPLLFVGNHTLYGIIDAPILFFELYKRKQIYIRALGDKLHFKIPVWKNFLRRYGVVEGNRDNCAALMKSGQSLLVFPGGAREVAKKKGEKYKLVWKQRMGFAHMAIKHQCTIVPFAAVGVEDMFDILFDSDGIMASPIGHILRKLDIRKDLLLPIALGAGPFKLPRLERLYFQFGEPISTADYKGQEDNKELCWELRERTRLALEDDLEILKKVQDNDPDRWFRPSFKELKRNGQRWLKPWQEKLFKDKDPGND